MIRPSLAPPGAQTRSQSEPAARGRAVGVGATLMASAVILCAVAIINGGPIIYPDSGLYISDGERVMRLTAPLAVRPVFYGLAVWLLDRAGTVWPVLIAQGLVIAHLTYLTLRTVGAALGAIGFLALIAALAVLTPLSWHVSHVLPDVLTGALILAIFLLGFRREQLTRAETLYLFLLAAACICFHLSNLPIALMLCAGTLLLRLVLPATRHTVRPALAAGPVVLALVALYAFSLGVYQRLTLTPNSPPHLMARLIMDGPGREYLETVCPGGADLVICKHLEELPDSYEGFLWVFMKSVPYDDGKQIRAQEGQVVRGTLAMYPGRVLWHALENTANQIITFDSRTDFAQVTWEAFNRSGTMLARDAHDTLQSRGLFDGHALDDVNLLHGFIGLVSFIACLSMLRPLFASRLYAAAWLIAFIFAGLLANAFSGGALSGVFGRYQGRVIWLLPLGAVAAAVVLTRARAAVLDAAGPLPGTLR